MRRASVEFYAMPSMFQKDWKDKGKSNAIADWKLFAEKLSNFGVKHVTVFPYQKDSRDPYFRLPNPYKDNWKWDRRWWRRYKKFLDIFSSYDINVRPIGYSKYQWLQYEQDFGSVWSIKARQKFVKYWKRLLRTHAKRFDKVYARISNECRPRNKLQALDIVHFHEYIYESTKDIAILECHNMDVSGSDFCKMEECGLMLRSIEGHGFLPIMLKEYADKPMEWKKGYYIYGRWGKEQYDRRGWIEWHGMSLTKLDSPTEEGGDKTWRDVMRGSAWKKYVWNLDGCTTGNGYVVPSTNWRGLTDAETYDWAKEALRVEKSFAVKVWLAWFPMDIFILKDGMLVEDKDLFPWSQLGELQRALDGHM